MKKFIVLFLVGSFSFAQTSVTSYQVKIDAAKKAAEQFLDEEKIPGMSISVSKDGLMIWTQGFGYLDIGSKSKVSPGETQFRIASISKSLTATALAKLTDEGRLDLDKSIYTYIPNYPKRKYDFTIRQVGGHIAGIRHYRGKEFIYNKKMTITEGLNIFKNDSLLFKPGTKYSYSTYGWNLISEVVQIASDEPFNKYMESIFDPLKMNSTTLDVSDSIMPNRTNFYIKTNANEIILGPKVSNEHKVAGGGFISTSEDLIHFGNEIISPLLLSEESIDELLKPQMVTSGKSTNYGVGFGVDSSKNGSKKYSHSGGGIGASTLLLMYPEEKIVIVILTNLSQAPVRDFGSVLESIFIH